MKDHVWESFAVDNAGYAGRIRCVSCGLVLRNGTPDDIKNNLASKNGSLNAGDQRFAVAGGDWTRCDLMTAAAVHES